MTAHAARVAPFAHTLELPPALGENLARWNADSGHDQTPVLLEAMTEFVARESAIASRIKKSMDQADKGQYASPEKVAAIFAKYGC